MNRFVSRIACAAALLATPGLAHAGTSTATGSASMNVLNQCSVTGANVNLGTFTTNNTWADVGSQLGYWGEAMYSYGSQGASYANFGSVTCDAGTPYTLQINGTESKSGGDAPGGLKLTVNGKTVVAMIFLKQIGAANLPEWGTFPGLGTEVNRVLAPGTGTGSAQALKGSLMFEFSGGTSSATLDDKLAAAGTYTDTLTYTLNF